MRPVILAVVGALAVAAACTTTSAPISPPQRATVNVIFQDSTYKPLLATQASFYAVVGQDRAVRLVYQGTLPTDSGAELLRFEVPSLGLLRKPDGTSFGLNDSIKITVTVLDPKKFLFDFQPAGLQFNPNDPAHLKVEFLHANHDYNGDGVIDSTDTRIGTQLGLWRRDPPDTLWDEPGAVRFDDIEEFDANVLSFCAYAVAW